MSASDSPFATLYKPHTPESQKSGLRKFWESVTAPGETGQKLVRHAEATGHAVREYAETGLTGLGLGVLHAADPMKTGTGLDMVVRKAIPAGGADGTAKAKDGTIAPAKSAITVPIDGALAGVGLVASLMTAGSGVDGVSTDLRHLGAAGMAVFGFRKGADVMAAKQRAAGKATGGTVPSLVSLWKEANAKATMHGEGGDFGNESQRALAGQQSSLVAQATQLLGHG